ncbi:TonB-dependent receptor, partial [Aegicerativicinus sediminis]
MKTILKILVFLGCVISYGQTTVSGKITDDTGMPLPGANIKVVGTSLGTISDFDGNYTLTVDLDPPFSIEISFVGFTTITSDVTSNNQTLDFQLNEGTELDEVVIAASRTPERIFESPVTVERFGAKDIKNSASAEFYDALENLKGVDINTNSLTFKAINTRGFATFANNRFMQLVDGMDNSAPALNFPLGNLLGMIETDVHSVEILPGAASALYGANAFNGILFMRSKNPFEFPGISGYIKQGITSQDVAGTNSYTDVGVRVAHKFSDKFAAKFNVGYLTGTDWMADNQNDRFDPNKTRAATDYNGVNVYGDEIAQNIRTLSGLGIVPDVVVSRTGYSERDLTDYNAKSLKADLGLFYRPWGTDFEISYQGKYGTGNTIYQGSNRYYIDGFDMQQHKLEVRNDNFFVRGYITEDRAGDSYDMIFTAFNINQAWKSNTQWFQEYIETYVGASLNGATENQAHAAARAKAESGRYEPGSSEFNEAFNRIIKDPDLTTGSRFQDNSKFTHLDANYNFGHLWDPIEIQVGGSYRKYELNSFGTIYTDADSPILYSEFGLYTQLQKTLELSEEVDLKLTGSMRYDKSELFDGFVSPRLSAGLTFNKNHNIRASVQTGFRNPTTQDLYIGLDTGFYLLAGAAKDNLDRYTKVRELSPTGANIVGSNTVTLTGRDAYENSYSGTSVNAFAASAADGSPNPGLLEIGNPELVKPEKITAYEIGYRGKFERTVVDLNLYYNRYEDFMANEFVITPYYGEVGDNSLSLVALANDDYELFQTYTNSKTEVSSLGGSIGLSTKVFGDFDLGANYTYTEQDFDQEKYPDFRTNFNTPKHKVKATFGNTSVAKNLGFNVAWRWSDTYFWQASFG